MRGMPEADLPPAPGADEHICLALVNSVRQLPGGHYADELASPEETSGWLISRRLVADGTTVNSSCRNLLISLREDLRELFIAHATKSAIDTALVDAVNRALTNAPHTLLLRHTDESGFFRAAERPARQAVKQAVSNIAEDAASLLINEQAAFLTQCEAEPCDRLQLSTQGQPQCCSSQCAQRLRAAREYTPRRVR